MNRSQNRRERPEGKARRRQRAKAPALVIDLRTGKLYGGAAQRREGTLVKVTLADIRHERFRDLID